MDSNINTRNTRNQQPTADPHSSLRRLFEGEPLVASFDSTSQYAQGGSSACGLASLNAVRIVLDAELKGTRNAKLLERMASRQFAMDVASICSVWAGDAHLEIDDIYTLPLFDKSLVLVHSVYEQSNSAKLKQLLLELRHYGEQASVKAGRPIPIGAVITRPPEILSILHLPTPGQPLDDIFVVFDSHSRPSKHPNGSAFLFFPTLEKTAAYLGELLHVDSSLLDGSPGMSWQTQLLSCYSGHFFIARKHRVYDTDSSNALYDANMCILELKLSQTEMKSDITELRGRIQALESENSSLLARIKTSEKGKSVQRPSTSHSRSGISPTLQNSMTVPADRYSNSSSSARTLSSDPASTSYAAAANRAKSGVNSGKAPAHRNPSEQTGSQSALHMQADIDESRLRETATSSLPHSLSRGAGPSSYRVASLAEASGSSHKDSRSHKPPKSEPFSASADEASFLLASQMQADFSAEDSNLRSQLHDLQRSQSTFQCGICIDDHRMDDICAIHSDDERGHNFCRACLKEHITIQLQERRFPIFCPMCVADRTVEPRAVMSVHVEQLGLSQEHADLWTELELAKYSLVLPCPKCQRFAHVDREDHNSMPILFCPFNCGYVWCKACQQQVNQGVKHSCDGTEELKQLMKDKGYKACPGCDTPTEKIHGCNHMTCEVPHCNTHFCYRCGRNIVHSLNREQIKLALEAHYRTCALFELPA